VIDEGKERGCRPVAAGGHSHALRRSRRMRKTLYIFTTQMVVETVDLETRKVTSSFNLADPNTHLRIQGGVPDRINVGSQTRVSGLAVDPNGRTFTQLCGWW